MSQPASLSSDPPPPRLRKGLLLALLAALAGAAIVYFFAHRAQENQERSAGLRAAREGRLQEAEPLLRRALARQPDDLPCNQALALGLLGAGQLAEAEPYLDRWCALQPNDSEPFRYRLDLRHREARAAPAAAEKQRLRKMALADGRHALELGPWDDTLAAEVAWLALEVGEFAEADRLCRRCRQHQPDDPWPTYLLAKIDHARGKNEEACALLDALLPQQPRFALALLLRGALANEAADYERALPLLRQAIAFDPTLSREANYQLGLALARTGQREEARQVLAQLQRGNLDALLTGSHDTGAPGLIVQQAEACLAAGNQAEALRLLQPLLTPEPGYAPAHALLASYYERQGQAAEAAAHRRLAGP